MNYRIANSTLIPLLMGVAISSILIGATIEGHAVRKACSAQSPIQPEPRVMTPEEFEAYESARKNMHRETSTRLAIDAAARRGVADGMEQAHREAQGASK